MLNHGNHRGLYLIRLDARTSISLNATRRYKEGCNLGCSYPKLGVMIHVCILNVHSAPNHEIFMHAYDAPVPPTPNLTDLGAAP